MIHCIIKEIPESEQEEARAVFFRKGQPCLRASPLTKRCGWGVHYNEEQKIAIYPLGKPSYEEFVKDNSLQKVAAMSSKRKKHNIL